MSDKFTCCQIWASFTNIWIKFQLHCVIILELQNILAYHKKGWQCLEISLGKPIVDEQGIKETEKMYVKVMNEE